MRVTEAELARRVEELERENALLRKALHDAIEQEITWVDDKNGYSRPQSWESALWIRKEEHRTLVIPIDLISLKPDHPWYSEYIKVLEAIGMSRTPQGALTD